MALSDDIIEKGIISLFEPVRLESFINTDKVKDFIKELKKGKSKRFIEEINERAGEKLI